MACITVDQKLIGGKLRDFAKRSGISQNEAIGILIRLWLWGIDNAEESGRIVAAEHEDIEEAIRPGFLEIDRSTISNIVDNLIECGWIDQEDGSLYLHDWMDWRSYYTSYEQKKASYIQILNSASLLIIDDLGAERNTDYALEKVYNVIDSRIRTDKPMILTTNLELSEMLQTTDIRYRRVYDRIFETCYPVEMPGKSFRQIEAAQRFNDMKELLQ